MSFKKISQVFENLSQNSNLNQVLLKYKDIF